MTDIKESSADSHTIPNRPASSRRRFLRAGVVGIAGGVAASMASKTGTNLVNPLSVSAQNASSPEDALKLLMAGNQRFASGSGTAHEHDLEAMKRHLAAKQEPFAAVLTCADSRIPVEMVFDQSMGHLFVTRLAGNMVTPEIIASLEYGAAVLGTKVIMVMGHSDCGAVKAAIAGKQVPGQISALYPHLQPAVDQAGPEVRAVTEANARIQAKLLREASTVVAANVKEGQLKVVAGYYDIASGVVSLLD